MERNRGVSRRRVITSALGSVAGLTVVAAAGSPAAAASQKPVGGVAEVVGTASGRELLVRNLKAGTTFRVPARDFGGMAVSRGDLVAVLPDLQGATRGDTLAAYPYLQIDNDGKVWSFDRDDAHPVGRHA